MHFSVLGSAFIAAQAANVSALPPGAHSADELELASFTPSNPINGWPDFATTSSSTANTVTNDFIPWTPSTLISGWPHGGSSSASSTTLSTALSSTSYFTTTASQVVTATTITVTDNSITWTPAQSISGWPPSGSQTHTEPGQALTETFTITYTTYSEETILLPPASSITSSTAQNQTPLFTFVTVTATPTSLDSTPTRVPPFTVITVTATPTTTIHATGTPRFTTITVSEVTIWPTHTTAQSSTQTPRVVTLTFSSSSVNWSLNSTTVSYSSTVMTLNPPSSSATGIATVGVVNKRHM
ncbi:hypothetical protein SAMD00023353_1001390 [Rosellinia necatrix]|uniref:Uncharacterized protein n=1 Tax=Rosellinia necatrix TaxID=77044 RepID=A0A1W2TBS0_ROSNE|nr:hypothetical protein SAMD00023353_1001390 [Rosellinia necatrix]